ncbi:MAG: hypothetical protein K6E64_07160 [Lachnospiraceae bacterium]|nr:hypothetical protein [Lachnospiraceae bacterium]
MHEVVKEYGPALIAVIAIIALVALIVTLIGTNGDSVVGKAFSTLINTFFENANAALKN